MVWEPEPYERQGPVDWATGAAILISAEADAAVGDWDSGRFFLYSEETDYCRRLREAGHQIRYVPDAVVSHKGGGSGTGADLVALNEVNRVRYYRKYHGRLATAAFRAVVALSEVLRAYRPANRRALRAVLSRRSGALLPGGDR
jgi:GT2 family glycosyltransferase